MSSRGRDAAILVPGVLGSAGLGLLITEDPPLAGGLVGLGIMAALPWAALFALLVLFSAIQSPSYWPLSGVNVLGGINLRPDQAILVVFFIRAYLGTRPDLRLRWRAPEWLLFTLAVFYPITTFFHAPNLSSSIPVTGLLLLGVAAYLAVYVSVCTPRRLIFCTRVFLGVIAFNAAFGVLAELAYLAVHSHIGISTGRDVYGQGVYGLSFEHDIFASTCAAGSVAFYSLWRERNPVLSSKLSGAACLLCGVGAILGLARGAWLGLALAVIALVALVNWRGMRRPAGVERIGFVMIIGAFVVFVAAYILVVAANAPPTSVLGGIQQKTHDLLNFNSSTGQARVNEAQQVFSDLRSSPVLGLGAGTYAQRHPQNIRNNYIGNIYLRTLYEAGGFGALLLIAALAIILWPTRSLLRSRANLAPVARALTFGWLVLTVAYAATDDSQFMWPWIFLGLVHAARVMADREAKLEAPRRLAPLAAPLDGSGNGFRTKREPLLGAS